MYKQEFMRFIAFSVGSNDETMDHLETLFETGSLKNEELYLHLKAKIEILGKKLNSFLSAVEKQHLTKKRRDGSLPLRIKDPLFLRRESTYCLMYPVSKKNPNQVSCIQHQVSKKNLPLHPF